jgi:hypothetical protein
MVPRCWSRAAIRSTCSNSVRHRQTWGPWSRAATAVSWMVSRSKPPRVARWPGTPSVVRNPGRHDARPRGVPLDRTKDHVPLGVRPQPKRAARAAGVPPLRAAGGHFHDPPRKRANLRRTETTPAVFRAGPGQAPAAGKPAQRAGAPAGGAPRASGDPPAPDPAQTLSPVGLGQAPAAGKLRRPAMGTGLGARVRGGDLAVGASSVVQRPAMLRAPIGRGRDPTASGGRRAAGPSVTRHPVGLGPVPEPAARHRLANGNARSRAPNGNPRAGEPRCTVPRPLRASRCAVAPCPWQPRVETLRVGRAVVRSDPAGSVVSGVGEGSLGAGPPRCCAQAPRSE